MKRFDFPLDQFQLSRLTSSLRNKKDVIRLWMNSIKMIAAYVAPPKHAIVGRLVLHVDRMSRLFIESQSKSFSISFPFQIRENKGMLEFSSTACSLVDSKVTSDILALVNGNNVLGARNVAEFADPLLDLIGDQDAVWELLRDLMMCDDGYIRVDHDPANVNGAIHPLDHIDIFYSQSATFKIGISKRADLDEFHDILNTRSECHFLVPKSSTSPLTRPSAPSANPAVP